MGTKVLRRPGLATGLNYYNDELYHFGIKGMKWGQRRFQNKDGSYTSAGLARERAEYKNKGDPNSKNPIKRLQSKIDNKAHTLSKKSSQPSEKDVERYEKRQKLARKAKTVGKAVGITAATALALYGANKFAKSDTGQKAIQNLKSSKLGGMVSNAGSKAATGVSNRFKKATRPIARQGALTSKYGVKTPDYWKKIEASRKQGITNRKLAAREERKRAVLNKVNDIYGFKKPSSSMTSSQQNAANFAKKFSKTNASLTGRNTARAVIKSREAAYKKRIANQSKDVGTNKTKMGYAKELAKMAANARTNQKFYKNYENYQNGVNLRLLKKNAVMLRR